MITPLSLKLAIMFAKKISNREAERKFGGGIYRPRPQIERVLEYNACQQLTWN